MTRPHRDSESLYRLLTDSAADVISLSSPDGIMSYISPSIERMLGIRPADLIGTPTGLRLHDEDRMELVRARAELLAGGDISRAVTRIQHAEGHWLWIDIQLHAVRDASGALQEIHAVSRDVTERRKAREELALRAAHLEALNLRLEEQDRYKDEFLSVMSHELRTPLNAIMGFTSLLGEQVVGPLTPEQQGFLRQVMASADRMLVLVEDLLDQGKMMAGHFQVFPRPIRFDAIIDMAVRRVAEQAAEKGIPIAVADFTAISVWVDEARVVQVVANMLSNAVTFTPAGGRIDVRVEAADGYVTTHITDTGIGIDPAHQALLFTRFTQLADGLTRRTGGTGLGLSICKAIVDAHHGTIGVSSEPGRGSTFWFCLPVDGPGTSTSEGSSPS